MGGGPAPAGRKRVARGVRARLILGVAPDEMHDGG